MNKQQLITLAADSKELKGFCYKLCNGNDIHLDMFQEFLIKLLECPEDKLVKKYYDLHFIGYCYFILKRLNNHRLRDSKYINSKNCLSFRNDISLSEYDLNIEDSGYNHEIDEKFEKTLNYLEKDKSIKKYQAVILFASVDKSTREISEMIGTKERVIIYQNNKLKQKIKENVK